MSRLIRHFKAPKYGSKSCRCHLGHCHQSVFEAEYCDQLGMMCRARAISSFASQVSYPLCVNGTQICTHIVDFVVHTKDGKEEIHEVKGFATPVWELKYKLFKALYPELKYLIITKDYYASRDKYSRPRRRRTY